jgi:hypothetical protein
MRICLRIDGPVQQDAFLHARGVRTPRTALHGIADEVADEHIRPRRPSTDDGMREVVHARNFNRKSAEKSAAACIAVQISYFCRPPAEAVMRE